MGEEWSQGRKGRKNAKGLDGAGEPLLLSDSTNIRDERNIELK